MEKKIYNYQAESTIETYLDKEADKVKFISKKSFQKAIDDGLEYRIVGKTKLKEVEDKDCKRVLAVNNKEYVIDDYKLTVVKGYIPVGDGLFVEYRKTIVPFIIILLGLLALCLFFLLKEPDLKPLPVIEPDYELVEDDKNQVQVEEIKTGHTILVTLPEGEISLKEKIYTFENESLKANKQEYKEEDYSGKLKLAAYMLKDKDEYLIFDDEVDVKDGKLEQAFIDFLSQKTELLAGVYDGRIILAYSEEEIVETDLTVVIRNRTGGTMDIGFDPNVEIDLASGNIKMKYQAGSTATHDTILQLILDSNEQEYLLSESGVIKPGNGLTKMQLLDNAPALRKGQYSGRLRLNFYGLGSNESLTGINTDIEVTIKVH